MITYFQQGAGGEQDGINNCKCGNSNAYVRCYFPLSESLKESFFVHCPKCLMDGIHADSFKLAVKLWNKEPKKYIGNTHINIIVSTLEQMHSDFCIELSEKSLKGDNEILFDAWQNIQKGLILLHKYKKLKDEEL